MQNMGCAAQSVSKAELAAAIIVLFVCLCSVGMWIWCALSMVRVSVAQVLLLAAAGVIYVLPDDLLAAGFFVPTVVAVVIATLNSSHSKWVQVLLLFSGLAVSVGGTTALTTSTSCDTINSVAIISLAYACASYLAACTPADEV